VGRGSVVHPSGISGTGGRLSSAGTPEQSFGAVYSAVMRSSVPPEDVAVHVLPAAADVPGTRTLASPRRDPRAAAAARSRGLSFGPRDLVAVLGRDASAPFPVGAAVGMAAHDLARHVSDLRRPSLMPLVWANREAMEMILACGFLGRAALGGAIPPDLLGPEADRAVGRALRWLCEERFGPSGGERMVREARGLVEVLDAARTLALAPGAFAGALDASAAAAEAVRVAEAAIAASPGPLLVLS